MKQILLVALCFMLLACKQKWPWPELTCKSVASSGEFTVEVREDIHDMSDRHFRVILINHRIPSTNIVYRSPDEGNPESERIFWNTNGNSFLLTGRNLGVYEHGWTPSKQNFYLLHDINTGSTWCNSAQAEGYKPFTTNDLKSRGFDLKGIFHEFDQLAAEEKKPGYRRTSGWHEQKLNPTREP